MLLALVLPNFWYGLLTVIFLLTGVFLILLVLIQRGRGGGLIGALGGTGGSSPFGSRAGDVFTRITIGVAAFWIMLAMFLQPGCSREDLLPSQPEQTTVTPAGQGP